MDYRIIVSEYDPTDLSVPEDSKHMVRSQDVEVPKATAGTWSTELAVNCISLPLL
jgi:hypothetical protein